MLALMFLIAGFGKVTGSKMHVEGFKQWRLLQWFRVVTGIVEIIGAAALIIGYWESSWVAAGALLLGLTAIGGVLTHIRVRDSFKQTFMILVLGIISIFVFLLRYSELFNFPGF
ncbi:DoxX family protein [Paenibacillus taichungensis]|uniref:DoxX family protein n=1 Tax=Paenibacillus taichungensis TaxID=484184 RepID=UPI0031B5FAD2